MTDFNLEAAKRRHRDRAAAIKRIEVLLVGLESDLHRETWSGMLRHRFMTVRRELDLLRREDQERSGG